ncbi:MAG TPA: MMPL family transporter [Caulobacteraceae bacterium]|nr:MMPL family transporter [Caulobacteraceae bacterium]
MTEKPSVIARLVGFSADRPLAVMAAGLIVTVLALIYAMSHFAMTTDTDKLLSTKLPFRQREAQYNKLFPEQGDQIVVVIDGQTPEIAEQAAADLAAKLAAQPNQFPKVSRPDATPFFQQNGLLFTSLDDVKSATSQLITAEPFLAPLAADPSLRGLMTSLSTATTGVTTGQARLDQIDRPLKALADALQTLKDGKPAFFSWRALITGGAKPDPRQLRHIILVGPKLDFSALEAGAKASELIRQDARELKLDAAHGVRVRQTGPIPLQDEEFATLTQGAGLIATAMLSAIVFMLWFAVRSARLIAVILGTTIAGLVMVFAWGLLAFHLFNVISVAFIPLFVGLGVDFGIQFSVRYRTEQRAGLGPRDALVASGRIMGRSLGLAATAIAAGFLAFAPTDYLGVSQLGVIAGVGMFIALGLNLTVLPALIKLVRPPNRPESGTLPIIERLDHVMLNHRRLVVGTGVTAALISLALTPLLHLDFNPLHLRSAKTESVSTLLDLTKDPDQTPNTIDVLAPSLNGLDGVVTRLSKLPEVASVRTIKDFVPKDQDAKLAVISDASLLLDTALNPIETQPEPTDADTVAALAKTAQDLRQAAGSASLGASAQDAQRLAGLLDWLAQAGPGPRARASQMLIPGLNTMLNQARSSLQAQPVTLQTLPETIKQQWIASNGQALALVTPRGDSNNDATLRHFAQAVLKIYPNALGTAISIQEAGHVVVRAFTEAGLLSFIAITILLLFVLRRIRDVAITMAPILLTGLLTLGTCVVIGQPINFANIIALPLLFGIGVAFHIYFVMAWRAGGSHLLQSSLTRGVFFSAMTTATAFGSLWISSHPGTASMGKLLMISLIWTLVSALLFQPALMGPPPKKPAPADPLADAVVKEVKAATAPV